jgi:hypothetical protein
MLIFSVLLFNLRIPCGLAAGFLILSEHPRRPERFLRVTQKDASEARKSATAAISSDSPNRPRGVMEM